VIVGHYATALIPHSRVREAPLWLFLLVANLSDFVWLLCVPFGLEKTEPRSFLDVSFKALQTDMPYSHDLVPLTVTAAVVAGAVFAVWRLPKVAMWCGALMLAHFACDWLCGYQHHLFGEGTPTLGLGLYSSQPHLAIVIEALFGAACVYWFVRSEAKQSRPLPKKRALALYAVFVGGALVWLPTATLSLNQVLGR
jgi:hypothetical protein